MHAYTPFTHASRAGRRAPHVLPRSHTCSYPSSFFTVAEKRRDDGESCPFPHKPLPQAHVLDVNMTCSGTSSPNKWEKHIDSIHSTDCRQTSRQLRFVVVCGVLSAGKTRACNNRWYSTHYTRRTQLARTPVIMECNPWNTGSITWV